ncbi:MAG: N-6 DNA methylase, partial [Oscillospiraceae bacterium]|nr:N-6 DNA methylase [Oscillospiraceae bacterium]
MHKGDLKNLAIQARQYLLETAVSYGMNEMQSKETAYFCFMKSVMQCYLDENKILMQTEQIFPHWNIPACFHSIQTKLMHFLKAEIPHEIWTSQVQMIGWMHQYYHTEYKDAIFLKKKRTSRISEQDIAVTTQFFTPQWLGKYLTENSLGRFWNETHVTQKLSGLRYFIPEQIQSEQTRKIKDRIQKRYQDILPEKIRFLDPCMGTGHILLEAFDVFMQIYHNSGYDTKTAVKYILEKNLWGLELEQHTCEIAGFMLLMKAVTYDPSYLSHPIKLNIASFQNDKIYGSLLDQTDIPEIDRILMQDYHIVVSNPPYMGNSGMPETLSAFVKQNYPDSKQDLYACFIERCYRFTKPGGYFAMLTMHGWMFLSSFTKLREKLFQNAIMINLLHLGAYGFDLTDVGTIVQTAGFVMQKLSIPEYTGIYINLCEIHDSEQKHQAFLDQKASMYFIAQEYFSQIPNSPMIYWASEQVFQLFHGKKLGDFAEPKQGITTSDNQKFVRKWYEVIYSSICFHAKNPEQATQSRLKWFPYQKGGGYRKW